MLSAIEAAMTALEQSGLGVLARGSAWLYPLANLAHVLGAALLVGAIATFDVQLLRGAPHPRTTYRAAMRRSPLPTRAASPVRHRAAGGGRGAGDGHAASNSDGDVRPGLVNVAAFCWRYGGALKADAPLDWRVGFAAYRCGWVLVLLAGRARRIFGGFPLPDFGEGQSGVFFSKYGIVESPTPPSPNEE